MTAGSRAVDDVLALIRRGINDPGSVLPRETYDANDGTGFYDEGVGAWGARAVYKRLTDAGWSLLPPGGQTRTEWGVWYPTDTANPRWQLGSTPDAEQAAREHMADGYGERHSLKLVSRTVHTTPWQPSDTPGEPA